MDIRYALVRRMSMAWMLRIVALAGLAPVLLLGQLLFEQSTKDVRLAGTELDGTGSLASVLAAHLIGDERGNDERHAAEQRQP
jgi:hypothetical protein